ncbi:MAG: B12-binding domain-containing protein [Phycisphaeraceae bacterium]|nr:B12-binding domain-containing protein [Phycisphaeraceae bacterium]
MKFHLSPKELGKAIGLSKSSLTRWVDDQVIEAPRTAGGHRRIPITEAVRFIRESGSPVVYARALGFAEFDKTDELHFHAEEAFERIIKALHQGDGVAVRRIVLAALLCGESIPKLFDGPFRRAMMEIGELWHHDQTAIITEHRATDICIQAINQLRSLFPPADDKAPVAVGGALEGDPYLLPSLMVATTLASQGWQEMNIGPGTPAEAIAQAARQSNAELAWLSISVPIPPPELGRQLKTLLTGLPRGCRLVIGGRYADQFSSTLPSEKVQYTASMCELAAFAKGLTLGLTEKPEASEPIKTLKRPYPVSEN